MENPKAKGILTIGALLAAIYFGSKEIKEIKKRIADKTSSKKVTTGKTAIKPKDSDILSEDVDSASKPQTAMQALLVSTNNGMNAPNPASWGPGCHNCSSASSCSQSGQTFGARVYCSCFNNQPNTIYAPNMQLFPKFQVGNNGSLATWESNGTFYDNTNTPPQNKSVGPLWDGGPVPINLGFYGWYFNVAVDKICSFFHISNCGNPKPN